jgi:hypothetical protein
MEMPKLTDAHRKLQALAGTWVGNETMSPSPWGPGGVALGRNEIRIDLGGFFALQDYTQERDGRAGFRGHGIFGWDAERQAYTWYWIDSIGFPPDGPAYGQWQGDTLTFTRSTARGQGRHSFRFEGERTYHLTIANSFDGGATWLTFMEATYHRA